MVSEHAWEEVNGGGEVDALVLDFGEEVGPVGFEAGDGANAVGEDDDLLECVCGEVFEEVFEAAFDAMGAGFACDEDAVSGAQFGDEGGIELGRGVGGVGYFGAEDGEVFIEGVAAFGDFVDNGEAV